MNDLVWHEFNQGDRKCVPGRECRVLVAQDDGYIEMAEWAGGEFRYDWPPTSYAASPPPIQRVRYWADLPDIEVILPDEAEDQ